MHVNTRNASYPGMCSCGSCDYRGWTALWLTAWALRPTAFLSPTRPFTYLCDLGQVTQPPGASVLPRKWEMITVHLCRRVVVMTA